MSRTKILTRISTALAGTLIAGTASIAFAHQSDLHHWFEHERARIEGGELPIFEAKSTASVSADTDRRRAAAPTVKRNVIATAPDCLLEQMKISEGYQPAESCAGGYAERRWVVDEDKEIGRHAEQTRAR